MAGLKAAIIDLDGTLVDTLGDFYVALNRNLAELALPALDRTFIERTIGKGAERLRGAGLALACVTNKPRAFALDLLQRKDLSTYFAQVQGGDSFERRKPEPCRPCARQRCWAARRSAR